MPELAPKKVTLSQVVEDLNSGMTRWKKDDIGFGSIEKKYNLQMSEMIQLLAHPKLKDVESKIPTFIIVDDIEDEAPPATTTLQVAETQEVAAPQVKTAIVVKQEPVKEKKKVEAFI